MTKLLSLIKIQVKDFIGKSTNSLGVKNKLLGRLLMLFLVGVLVLPAVTFSTVAYKSLAAIGQGELLITTFYLNSIIFMFVFGIPFIISVFFFSRDARFLSALPVREDSLIFSKLATVYIYLLAISALLMGPALVVYLYNTGITILLIITAILALLMAPLLPLLISSIVILPFGNIFSSSSRRKSLILIFNILLLVVIIGFQALFSRYMNDPARIQDLLANGGLVELLGMRFPPSIWLTRMFMGSFLDAVFFIGLNIILILVLRTLARAFFRKAVLSFSEGSSISVGEVYYRERTTAYQMIKRNVLIIIKEPMFLLNTGLSLIAPLFIVVMMIFTGEFSMNLLNSAQIEPYLLLILSGVMIAPAIIGNMSSTAITREGQTFWETRVLPITAVNNIKYRIWTTIILTYLGSLLMLLVSIFVFPLTFMDILLASLFCITAVPFFSTIDIIINIYRPLLNWTNPTAAIKNNLNVTFSLLVRAIIAGIVFLLYKFVPDVFNNYQLAILSGSLAFVVLYLIVRSYVYTKGAEMFNNISI